ncbi:MAG: NAD-dependent epimerase/dehydratase family protein [Candidatus Hodarchaeota archaeon]
MKILITGGNGFIGSHLADVLIDSGYEITLLDIVFTRNTKHLTCEKIVGDVCDLEILENAAEGQDIFIHLAAVSRVEWGQKDPEKCIRVNVLGTLNAIKASLKNKSMFVYVSSREVFGEPQNLPVKEDDPKKPISVYGVSKLASELLNKTYALTSDLKYTVLRYSNVYGSPRDLPERVTPRFMDAALSGQPLTVYGGNQILDFNFIDDVVQGTVRVVEKAVDGDPRIVNNDFNLVSGRGTSISQLAKIILQLTKSDSEIIVSDKRSYDVSNFVGDIGKASSLLGYKPRHSLKEGLDIYRRRLQEVRHRK